MSTLLSYSAIPLADYYIIAGVVYQAPDLGSVLNSRLVSELFYGNLLTEAKRCYVNNVYH